MRDKEKKLVAVQMPVDFWEKAKEKAEKEDMSISQVIRKLLNSWMNEKQQSLNF